MALALSPAIALGQTTGSLGQSTSPSWELRDGRRWQRVEPPTSAPAPDETLDYVEEMIRSRQGQAAKRLVVAWLRSHRDSPVWDRGLYLLGQANFVAGNRIMSFYNFDELLDKYPGSRYYIPALERQYDIADQFLKGYKLPFLGMPLFDAKAQAIEILYRIQQRAPGSAIAEKSLLRTADHYYANSDFDLAADAYAAYVRAYPRSPYLSRVRLRQAFSALAQFRGVKFDGTPVIDARQQLVDLVAAYPTVAQEENIPSILQRIDAALAKKLYVTAEFYRRTGKPKAQALYYRHLVRTYPDSPEAALAREKLERMPASALELAPLPTPPTTRAASTRPVSAPNPESR